jgi:hypothetical protein
MPEETPEGLVSREELAILAEAFDRCAYSLVPGTPAQKEAQIRFEGMVAELYDRNIKEVFPSLPLHEFRAGVRLHCKEFLKRNRPA